MKLIYKNIKYALLSVVFVITACNPDIEETNPNLLDSSNFWQDLDDVELGLNSAYATLYSQTLLNPREESLRADLAWFGSSRPNLSTINNRAIDPTFYFTHDVPDTHLVLQRQWDTYYRGIFRANQVIEALDRIGSDSDSERWTQRMAEARFLRGLFHFYLHTAFNEGSIIIKDKVPVLQSEFFQPLSSREEVIAFIREDLRFAYNTLKPKSEMPSDEPGRATKAAAATVLGTSYLYEEEYSEASQLFNYIINSGDYELEQDVSKIHTTAGEFNSESIFEINFDSNLAIIAGTYDEEAPTNRLAFLSANLSQTFSLAAWINYAYKTEPMDPLDARNYVDGVVVPDFEMNKKSVPLRASTIVGIADDVHTIVYDSNINVLSNHNGLFGSGTTRAARGLGYFKAYTNHDLVPAVIDRNGNLGQRSSKNVILNRLSEVYLMQAECLIKTGDVQGALDVINRIRARWGLILLGNGGEFMGSRSYNLLPYTDNSLMQHLMDIEKPLEMSVEGAGMRFKDLRRWGRLPSRFQELANSIFYTVDMSYTDPISGNVRFKSNILVETERGDPRVNDVDVIDYEYDLQANNYNESDAYLPIPSNEVSTNQNLFN